MKNLNSYINNQYKLPDKLESKFRTFEEFLDINNLNEENIGDDAIDFFLSKNWSLMRERQYSSYIWNINENLKSHSSKELVNQILKKFNSKIISCKEDRQNIKNNNIIIAVPDDNEFTDVHSTKSMLLNNNKISNELQDLILFYNYYITYIQYLGDRYNIYLEPLYTKNIVDKIKANGGKIYHVTSIENAGKIIKSKMFRPKVGKSPKQDPEYGYRYFPRRMFFIANGKTKNETLNDIKSTLFDLEASDYCIFEINITKFNDCLFWEDNASESKNSVYCYTAIPFSFCKNIYNSIEELEQKLIN